MFTRASQDADRARACENRHTSRGTHIGSPSTWLVEVSKLDVGSGVANTSSDNLRVIGVPGDATRRLFVVQIPPDFDTAVFGTKVEIGSASPIRVCWEIDLLHPDVVSATVPMAC